LERPAPQPAKLLLQIWSLYEPTRSGRVLPSKIVQGIWSFMTELGDSVPRPVEIIQEIWSMATGPENGSGH
jgi:hypothetical protein